MRNDANWLFVPFVRSLLLVLFFFGLVPSAQAAIPASERSALLNLYNSTNGANWSNNTNWGRVAGTECTWYGVECDGTLSHIIGLHLSANNLVGTLPSLDGLVALQALYVSSDLFSGCSLELGGYCGSSPNSLTGHIPSLSHLTALQFVDLSSNAFTGPIPSLGGLAALRYFDAHSNQLTGGIPSLNGLALATFIVSSNQLSGPVAVAPATLIAGESDLCGNSLSSSGNQAVDAAWVSAQNTYDVAGGNWMACQTKLSPSDCIFDWAESTYPQFFAPAGAASATLAPYYYRYYSGTKNYLATSSADSHIWVLGPAFGTTPLDVGATTSFLTTAGCSQ